MYAIRGILFRHSVVSRPISSVPTTIKEIYKDLVGREKIKYDEQQYRLVKVMTKLQQAILDERNQQVRGLYIYGSVGTGKTFLMDILYDSISLPSKKRVHFHKFMLDVHRSIHLFKKELLAKYGRDIVLNTGSERDAIKAVAISIAREHRLLCFDEFQVTDIADAIIMTKLFGELWKNGVILIATSNRPPGDLYKGGLNRHYFLPFIDALEKQCIVHHVDSTMDYRTFGERSVNTYFTPLSPSNTRRLHEKFISSVSSVESVTISIMMNREIIVKGNADARTCWVTFAEMCESYRGAADYAAICREMDHIYMDGIPRLSVLEHDKARRFITFIDEVYDANKFLYWTSDCEPAQLFQTVQPNSIQDKIHLGTDHSWSTVEVYSERMPIETTERKQQTHGSFSDSLSSKTEEFTKDGQQVEMQLLEGGLASIQELSFAFRRAASRMNEISSDLYIRKNTKKAKHDLQENNF